MALDVLGAIALPIVVGLDLGDDGGAALLCLLEVRVDVTHVDQDAIDDVGD